MYLYRKHLANDIVLKRSIKKFLSTCNLFLPVLDCWESLSHEIRAKKKIDLSFRYFAPELHSKISRKCWKYLPYIQLNNECLKMVEFAGVLDIYEIFEILEEK